MGSTRPREMRRPIATLIHAFSGTPSDFPKISPMGALAHPTFQNYFTTRLTIILEERRLGGNRNFRRILEFAGKNPLS
eukprot:scaffold319_cov244-Pinguiococcus_pyrenoidosus.AAC.2